MRQVYKQHRRQQEWEQCGPPPCWRLCALTQSIWQHWWVTNMKWLSCHFWVQYFYQKFVRVAKTTTFESHSWKCVGYSAYSRKASSWGPLSGFLKTASDEYSDSSYDPNWRPDSRRPGMTWIPVIFSQFEKAIHLRFLSAQHGWGFGWGNKTRGWRGDGASTQVCFIDQAQDRRKPTNTSMNNAWDKEKGNRSAVVGRWIWEGTEEKPGFDGGKFAVL